MVVRAPQALVFDFDGLILDTETAALTAWQEAFREHGHELSLERWATIIGTVNDYDPTDDLEQLVAGLDREAVNTRRREREISLIELEELRPGVLDYLEEARRRSTSRRWTSSRWSRTRRSRSRTPRTA